MVRQPGDDAHAVSAARERTGEVPRPRRRGAGLGREILGHEQDVQRDGRARDEPGTLVPGGARGRGHDTRGVATMSWRRAHEDPSHQRDCSGARTVP